MAGDAPPFPLVATPFVDINGALSPDGRWLAYGSDETGRNVGETASVLVERGARVLLAGAEANGAASLAAIPSSPLLEPIVQIQSFYRAANALALARGLDPDRPPHLAKVTETR